MGLARRLADAAPIRRREHGFTLIELSVVIAIIGIIAAIAIPSYNESVRRTRRALAQGCLTQAAQFMERFYTTNLAYNQTTAGVSVPNPSCGADVIAYYDVALDSVDPTTFTLSATPINAQANDTCGTMRLTNTGQRSADGTGCW